MLTIRLTRKGKKNQPFFRVVVIDKRRSPRGGRVIENLGYKNPLTKKVSINKERALYWLGVGAKPSATVHNLFISEKIIEGKKINVSKTKKSTLAQTVPVSSVNEKKSLEGGEKSVKEQTTGTQETEVATEQKPIPSEEKPPSNETKPAA